VLPKVTAPALDKLSSLSTSSIIET